jgi:hypothetical protein
MTQKSDKYSWSRYCKALRIDPTDLSIVNSEYYQKGFKEWKILNENYSYYAYCLNN